MTEAMRPQKEKRGSGSRSLVMIVLFAVLLILAFASSIIVSVSLFSRTTREYREEIITKAARLAAGQIPGDRIGQWLDTGADEAYIETAGLLQSICNNTPYVQYLYVYQIRPDGCHVVFDLETMADELGRYDEIPEVSTDALGEVVEFDEDFADDIPTLLAGGEIGIRETRSSFGWLLTRYEPVYSDGRCVAYVGVDTSMIGVTEYNRRFAVWIVIATSLFLATLIAIGIYLYIHTRRVEKYNESERRRKEQQLMFEQTADALAGAIDAKDKYTNGHSRRVAEYSRKIAEQAGMSGEECEKVYFAALLHDVGKIGVPIEILSKKGRLTDGEFEQIRQHPVVGGEILSSIRQSPWLAAGARYHHERYDGKGYPEGLMGGEIPEIARIIAVADAYDAMTSNRSYRSAIPQHIVREELVKGIGTQFDPGFARIMVRLLDLDTEYRMKEIVSGSGMESTVSLLCDSIYHDCTDGVGITRRPARIRMCSQPDNGSGGDRSLPTLIVFDSLDGRVHPDEENNKDILYFEYAQIRLDGQVTERNVRKSEVRYSDQETDPGQESSGWPEPGQRYQVEAVRNRDHVLVRVSGGKRTFEVILALPDTSRFVYIAISGEHCEIHSIRVDTDAAETAADAIPRIAEEISFIRDCPTGDIPNVQVDGPRLDSTESIPVGDGLTLTFHTMSLPTARLVWHCPYIRLFASADGRTGGTDLRDLLLLRLNGESWESDEHAENSVQVERLASFEGWQAWKDENKKGLDCTVTIRREKDRITIQTENLGIAIRSVTTFRDSAKNVYVALTGDQCAITNIHISRDG